jgi:hypothetical protein
MDKANEGNDTRQLAFDLGFVPIVPPLSTRLDAWTSRATWYRPATRPSGCSADSRAFAGPSAASTNWTLLGFACFALIVEALR